MVQKNNGAFRNIRRLEKHTDDDRPFIYGRFCMLSVFLGVLLYKQFPERGDTDAGNSRQLLEQTAINLEDYLRSMRRISDAMYYSVIKDKDLEQEGMMRK